MTRIILTHEKDGTGYHEASTDEQWAESALRILTERWEEGYWYQDPDSDGLGDSDWAAKQREEIAKARALTKEQIEALPESARKDVLRLRRELEREIAYDARHRAWYDQAKRVVESQDASLVTVGKGRYEHQEPRAWRLLDQRSDAEYEGVELIDLGERGHTYR